MSGLGWELSLHGREPRSEGPRLPVSLWGSMEAPPSSAFSSPTPSWLFPRLCPTETRFAPPTLGLAMATRQTLGGKEDFFSQKSTPKRSPVVAVPRQPLSVVALPLPRA